jgi:hypothetical protein
VWHDANRSERVDRLATLVESCPFDPSNALGLGLRWREFDQLTFEVKLIPRAHRREPPQFVDTKAQQRMRSEWSHFHGQAHCHRRCMPPRSNEAFEWRLLSGRFVKMIGLRIELRRKPLDLFARDNCFRALKTHADSKIVEPFDHGPFSFAMLPEVLRNVGFSLYSNE